MPDIYGTNFSHSNVNYQNYCKKFGIFFFLHLHLGVA